MQQNHDKSDDTRETANSTRLIFAVLGGVLLVIVTLVTNYPAVSEWISAAAQAEFVNPDATSVGSTQIARPAGAWANQSKIGFIIPPSVAERNNHEKEPAAPPTIELWRSVPA